MNTYINAIMIINNYKNARIKTTTNTIKNTNIGINVNLDSRFNMNTNNKSNANSPDLVSRACQILSIVFLFLF